MKKIFLLTVMITSMIISLCFSGCGKEAVENEDIEEEIVILDELEEETETEESEEVFIDDFLEEESDEASFVNNMISTTTSSFDMISQAKLINGKSIHVMNRDDFLYELEEETALISINEYFVRDTGDMERYYMILCDGIPEEISYGNNVSKVVPVTLTQGENEYVFEITPEFESGLGRVDVIYLSGGRLGEYGAYYSETFFIADENRTEKPFTPMYPNIDVFERYGFSSPGPHACVSYRSVTTSDEDYEPNLYCEYLEPGGRERVDLYGFQNCNVRSVMLVDYELVPFDTEDGEKEYIDWYMEEGKMCQFITSFPSTDGETKSIHFINTNMTGFDENKYMYSIISSVSTGCMYAK